MTQNTTSNIKTHESLNVSYMCEILNRRVNAENIKDAMTTALKNVNAAPGACTEVNMLHVMATIQDIYKNKQLIILINGIDINVLLLCHDILHINACIIFKQYLLTNSIVLHMPLGVFKKWRSVMFVLTYNYFEE